jgi:diaminopimelate decarboxylase
VFGHGELQAALWAGVPGDKISVNGSSKNAQLIALAVSVGARITLDSEQELDLVIAATTLQRKSAQVRLRVRPDYLDLTGASDFFPSMTIRDAANLYKPGIEIGAAVQLGRRASAHPSIELTGSHGPPGPAQRGSRGLGDDGADFRLRSRAAGGGLGTLASIGTRHRRRPASAAGSDPSSSIAAPPLELFAESTAGALARGTARRRASIRADHAADRARPQSARQHRNSFEPRLPRQATDPAGSANLDRTRYHRDVSSRTCCWSTHISGRSLPRGPTPNARESRDRRSILQLRSARARCRSAGISANGDVIAFLDTGAYQDAAASNFNALTRPATVLVSGNRCTLIKRRETLEEIFARDIPLPEGPRMSRLDHVGLTVGTWIGRSRSTARCSIVSCASAP